MKTRMVEERIGEWLGPVDWSYPFTIGAYVNNSERQQRAIAVLKELTADPKGWVYQPSGFTCFEVLNVGMYDGWPYWKPTPAIGWYGPLSSVEVAFWYDLSERNLFRGKPSKW